MSALDRADPEMPLRPSAAVAASELPDRERGGFIPRIRTEATKSAE
jgi:hypothetical protein